jgi:triacylglycerol lipase
VKRKNQAILILISLILISPYFTCRKAILTASTDQNRNPILFLHGWTKTSGDWTVMMKWFRNSGWPNTALHVIDFQDTRNSSVQANINNANQVKYWVDQILENTGAEKIDLIGHSMGGLSSRYYIKFLGGIDTVDDYVSLGAPHHGCLLDGESFSYANSLLLSLNEGDETPGGMLNDTLGDRVAPYSSINYNGTHISGNISYTSIYSRDDKFIPFASPPLDGAYNIAVENIGHSDLYQDWSVFELVRKAVDDLNNPFPPTEPISLSAVTGDGQVTLSWEVPIDDGGVPITEYRIYRTDSLGGSFFFLGNTSTLSYIDLNVTNGKSYWYVVSAVNSVGESDFSTMLRAKPHVVTVGTSSTIFSEKETSSSSGFILVSLSLIVLISFRRRKK